MRKADNFNSSKWLVENKMVMFDKDREEFNQKLEMLFDEYHHATYLIDDVWEMKDKIKAKVLAFKKD
jgi:transcriptional regulator of aromatic amino acid metabolism